MPIEFFHDELNDCLVGDLLLALEMKSWLESPVNPSEVGEESVVWITLGVRCDVEISDAGATGLRQVDLCCADLATLRMHNRV